MKRLLWFSLGLFFSVTVISNFALAKIGPPPSLQDGNITYEGYRHTIRAVDSKSKTVLWETEIPMDKYRTVYIPMLEEDVQLNVIESLKLKNDLLVAKNGRGQTFYLNKDTGKLTANSRNISNPKGLLR